MRELEATVHLFFDTETTGLPRDWKLPARHVGNWPRIVQIAWLIADDTGNIGQPNVHLVQPTGFRIPRDATAKHGITTEVAMQNGKPLSIVLDAFQSDLARVTEIIAHNIGFDAPVVGAEFIRAGRQDPLASKRQRCTMLESMEHCRIPGSYGNYKRPRLDELYWHLFNSGFEGAHDAGSDCLAGMKCYLRLREIGIM